MNIKMDNVSDGFFINLILQRTGHLQELNLQDKLQSWHKNGEKEIFLEIIKNKKIFKKYLDLLFEDINSEIKDLLPYFDKANFGNLISIGPGNALIELILQKKF